MTKTVWKYIGKDEEGQRLYFNQKSGQLAVEKDDSYLVQPEKNKIKTFIQLCDFIDTRGRPVNPANYQRNLEWLLGDLIIAKQEDEILLHLIKIDDGTYYGITYEKNPK